MADEEPTSKSNLGFEDSTEGASEALTGFEEFRATLKRANERYPNLWTRVQQIGMPILVVVILALFDIYHHSARDFWLTLIWGGILLVIATPFAMSLIRWVFIPKRPKETSDEPEIAEDAPVEPVTPEPTWTGPETNISRIADLQAEAQVAIERARRRIFARQNEPGFDKEKAEQRLQQETIRIIGQMEMEIANVQRGR